MIKVVIIDRHCLVRRAICRSLLDAEGIEVIGEAGSWPEAKSLIRGRPVDVAVIDLSGPGGKLQDAERLHRERPGIRILALDSQLDALDANRLLRAGAEGCLSKHCSHEEIAKAIRTVSSGGRYLSPGIALQIAERRLQYGGDDPLEALSERERQVMALITAGCSIQEIARRLGLGPPTIRTYRYRLFDKLGVSSDVELTHLAFRHGVLGRASGSEALARGR